MNYYIAIYLIILVVFPIKSISQEKIEYRILQGVIYDSNGTRLMGQDFSLAGTNYYTTTDINGEFCMVIPKGVEVYLMNPCCFVPRYFKVDENQQKIELFTGTRKTLRQSEKIRQEFSKNAEVIAFRQKDFYESLNPKIIESACKD